MPHFRIWSHQKRPSTSARGNRDETYVVTASRRRERVEDAPAFSVISKTEIRRESNTNLGDYLKGTKGIDFCQLIAIT